MSDKEESKGLKLLRQFCHDYRHWVEEGANPHSTFKRHSGLCHMFSQWVDQCHGGVGYYEGMAEMSSLFSQYPNSGYPFGGNVAFYDEGANNTKHKNPLRLAFVNHLADGETGAPNKGLAYQFHRFKYWLKY
ncbi:conserved hypothetical protein [Delftia phage PhiW-14]|uniref:Uncharacterized protein n=1 Tax=Delftia phage PhiW-14 TaxID=665032 RepID=C9DGD1_BPW14|nr:hypothetical protein DP-phiW-14_gp161 [Delftia phage PhiW-14]ACV50182.1 conserved hypothetical protein [Delftia phage PhiW-14]